MNYILDESTGVNRENYEMLAVAIITQAIRDLENGLALRKKLLHRAPKTKNELSIIREYEDAISFFENKDGCGWFTELCQKPNLDGATIIKKCRTNFKKYGKCLFSEDDWEKIRRGETKIGKNKKQMIYGG